MIKNFKELNLQHTNELKGYYIVMHIHNRVGKLLYGNITTGFYKVHFLGDDLIATVRIKYGDIITKEENPEYFL